MKQEIAELWVKALRSGEYKQGAGALRVLNGKAEASFCCLGVLCDLYLQQLEAGPGEWVAYPPVHNISGLATVPITIINHPGLLPPNVIAWAGMHSNTGHIDKLEAVRDSRPTDWSLIGMNDGSLYTFDQLADVIEKHREAL